MRGILFDLDGVLYVGDAAIPGAVEAVEWARREGVPHLFVTNTTSRPRSGIVERLRGIGIRIEADALLTPAVAAGEWLARRGLRVLALYMPETTATEFASFDICAGECDGSVDGPVDAVVVGDLGPAWTFTRLNEAFRLLTRVPTPALVALGMTRFWRAPDGLRLDTGPFVRALEYGSGVEAVVTGKPAGEFFAAAAARLGLEPGELVMVGDDIRGDIEGAQAAGMSGVMVRTGKFAPTDLGRDVVPDAVLDSVADLPDWWATRSCG